MIESSLIILIKKAQQNDNEALYKIVKKFKPLLLKNAVSLHYEEAFSDLTTEFIGIIKKIPINKMDIKIDAAILSYFKKSLYHSKIFLSKKQREANYVSPISIYSNEISYEDAWDSIAEYHDKYFFEKQLELPSSLTKREKEIISLLYEKNMKTKEIASYYNISSPAVTNSKQNAIKKLRVFYQ